MRVITIQEANDDTGNKHNGQRTQTTDHTSHLMVVIYLQQL